MWSWGTANHGHIRMFPMWILLDSGHPKAWEHVAGPNTGRYAQ